MPNSISPKDLTKLSKMIQDGLKELITQQVQQAVAEIPFRIREELGYPINTEIRRAISKHVNKLLKVSVDFNE